jgi:hypothetical protein
MDNAIYVNVPVGPSGCGKSSLAAERMHLYPDMMIVSKDKIREMFYGKYAYKHNFEDVVSKAAKEAMWVVLRNGNSLFVDETHTTIAKREEVLSLVRRFCTLCHPSRPIKVIAWHFKIGEGFVDYLIGKRMEENKGLDPVRWKKIIMDQVACLVPPTREEGFDEVYVIDRDKMSDVSFANICYDRQQAYAEKIQAYVFVSRNGMCCECGGNIWTVENVNRSFDELITSCPHCSWSFCE